MVAGPIPRAHQLFFPDFPTIFLSQSLLRLEPSQQCGHLECIPKLLIALCEVAEGQLNLDCYPLVSFRTGETFGRTRTSVRTGNSESGTTSLAHSAFPLHMYAKFQDFAPFGPR